MDNRNIKYKNNASNKQSRKYQIKMKIINLGIQELCEMRWPNSGNFLCDNC